MCPGRDLTPSTGEGFLGVNNYQCHCMLWPVGVVLEGRRSTNMAQIQMLIKTNETEINIFPRTRDIGIRQNSASSVFGISEFLYFYIIQFHVTSYDATEGCNEIKANTSLAHRLPKYKWPQESGKTRF